MINMFKCLTILTKFFPITFFPIFLPSFRFLIIFNVKRHGQSLDLALHKYFYCYFYCHFFIDASAIE